MQQIRFLYDENLGFPFEDEEWQKLFKRFSVECVGYDDMAKLTSDLKVHRATTAYLPAANYYYLREDPFYGGVATALAGGEPTFKSVLVVGRDSGVANVSQLKGKRLGVINSYCTSSYFGPALLLEKVGLSFSKFFSEIVPVGAWQKQLDALARGDVDATMVAMSVWLGNARNAQIGRVTDSVEGLPCPPVIMAKTAGSEWNEAFLRQLLKTPVGTGKLFSGFVPYQGKLMEAFFRAAEKAMRGL